MCAMVVAVGLGSCGGGSDGPVGTGGGGGGDTLPATNISEGWERFEAGNYIGANVKFTAARMAGEDVGEAFNGLGWTALKRNSVGWARNMFDSSLARGAYDPVEPMAGRAIASWDLQVPDAISSAEGVLAADPSFVFAHDGTLDWHDMRVILAELYFLALRYDDANDQVLALGGAPQEPSSPTFVEDLLAEIERLSSLYSGQ